MARTSGTRAADAASLSGASSHGPSHETHVEDLRCALCGTALFRDHQRHRLVSTLRQRPDDHRLS